MCHILGSAPRRRVRGAYSSGISWVRRLHRHGVSLSRKAVRQPSRQVLVISEILLLVEQVGSRTTQIYNLGAAVPVLFKSCTFEAVEGVGDALAAADDTLVLVVSEGAFVADAGERGRAHVRVADGAFAIALVAEAADRDASLLAAHDEVAESC
jgi:hypothetical protein